MSDNPTTVKWARGLRLRLGTRIMERLASARSGKLTVGKQTAFWRRAWKRAYDMGKSN